AHKTVEIAAVCPVETELLAELQHVSRLFCIKKLKIAAVAVKILVGIRPPYSESVGNIKL
ncbi:MAG: hypothetical protein II116_01790, partial [Ruminococcus sp.]|nr:hypothetical protein [Ruminococcus sp.]